MNRRLFLLLIFFIFVAPVLTLVHELGHAILPLALGEPVKIVLQGEPGLTVSMGKLQLVIKPVFAPWIGYTEVLSTYTNPWIALFGPFFSLLSFILFQGLATLRKKKRRSEALFFRAAAGWCLFQFLFTAVPLHYPSVLGYGKRASDMQNFIEMRRNHGKD